MDMCGKLVMNFMKTVRDCVLYGIVFRLQSVHLQVVLNLGRTTFFNCYKPDVVAKGQIFVLHCKDDTVRITVFYRINNTEIN